MRRDADTIRAMPTRATAQRNAAGPPTTRRRQPALDAAYDQPSGQTTDYT
jgi:hypothetical protein